MSKTDLISIEKIERAIYFIRGEDTDQTREISRKDPKKAWYSISRKSLAGGLA